MPDRALCACLSSIAFAATLLSAPTHAQAQSTNGQSGHPLGAQRASEVYEDREIKVSIPAGWRVVTDRGSKKREGTLLLEKKGYALSLGYHKGHTSGIVGGRFIEAFDMDWPGLDDAWTCSLVLREYPQPASRNLVFINLILNSDEAKVRENCAIPEELGFWTEKDGMKRYEGAQRWFGGYFTTAGGGYFFGSNKQGCDLKAYTLTSEAGAPDRFPIADSPMLETNPALGRMIQEAVNIVNSIHYKQCAPF